MYLKWARFTDLLIYQARPPPASQCSFHKTQHCGNSLYLDAEQTLASPKWCGFAIDKANSSSENRVLVSRRRRGIGILQTTQVWLQKQFIVAYTENLQLWNSVGCIHWQMIPNGLKMGKKKKTPKTWCNEVWSQMVQAYVLLGTRPCSSWRELAAMAPADVLQEKGRFPLLGRKDRKRAGEERE